MRMMMMNLMNMTHLMMMMMLKMMMSPQMMNPLTQMKSPLTAQMIHHHLHHKQQTNKQSSRSSGPNHVQYCFCINTSDAHKQCVSCLASHACSEMSNTDWTLNYILREL